MASLLNGSNSDGFFPRGDAYRNTFTQYVPGLVARLKAAVITVNTNMLKCVQEKSMQHIAVYLQMDGGCFENLL
jgi:hypothetical protein